MTSPRPDMFTDWKPRQTRPYVRRAPSRVHYTEPCEFAWLMAAYMMAQDEAVRPSDVLVGYTGRKRFAVVRARWKAWKLVKESFPHVSYAGIARVSGFDHSTIIRAMQELPKRV